MRCSKHARSNKESSIVRAFLNSTSYIKWAHSSWLYSPLSLFLSYLFPSFILIMFSLVIISFLFISLILFLFTHFPIFSFLLCCFSFSVTFSSRINLLKPTGFVKHQQLEHSRTVNSSHSVLICFVFIWEKQRRRPVRHNRSIIIIGMKSVYCEVGTGF
jgi:signal transduction histidine kinase